MQRSAILDDILLNMPSGTNTRTGHTHTQTHRHIQYMKIRHSHTNTRTHQHTHTHTQNEGMATEVYVLLLSLQKTGQHATASKSMKEVIQVRIIRVPQYVTLHSKHPGNISPRLAGRPTERPAGRATGSCWTE